MSSQLEYKEQRGWGVVEPVIDCKVIAPLCNHPYRGHPKGCKFGCKKKFWHKIIDPKQDLWALYFSMNLDPLWTKLRKRWPNWTEGQVQNNRYWTATKKKLLLELEFEFLKAHPGPWARVLNRAPGRINYTYGIWYNKTMEQIGVHLQWPPEPYPITVQFLGRPLSDDLPPVFMLEEGGESVKRPYRSRGPEMSEEEMSQEHFDLVDKAVGLSSDDFAHLL